MKMSERAEKFEAATETPSGKLGMKVVTIAFGCILTGLLVLILTTLQHTNELAERTQANDHAQDTSISLLQQRQTLMWNTLDTAVQTQQLVQKQVQENTDEIKHK